MLMCEIRSHSGSGLSRISWGFVWPGFSTSLQGRRLSSSCGDWRRARSAGDICFGDIDGVCTIPTEAANEVSRKLSKRFAAKLVRRALEKAAAPFLHSKSTESCGLSAVTEHSNELTIARKIAELSAAPQSSGMAHWRPDEILLLSVIFLFGAHPFCSISPNHHSILFVRSLSRGTHSTRPTSHRYLGKFRLCRSLRRPDGYDPDRARKAEHRIFADRHESQLSRTSTLSKQQKDFHPRCRA